MGFYQEQMNKRASSITNLGSSILKGVSKIALAKGIKSALPSMNKGAQKDLINKGVANPQSQLELSPVEMANNVGGNAPILDNTAVAEKIKKEVK